MPNVADGGNATITLSERSTVSVNVNGGSVKYENPLGTVVAEFGSDRTFGPLASGSIIKLTSVSGAFSYETGAAPYLKGDSPFLYNHETDNLIGIKDVDGAERTLRTLDLLHGGVYARTSITGVGDSIMAYGDGVGAGGSQEGPTSNSIIAWGMSQLGLPYNIVDNRGVGGSILDDVLSDQLPSAMSDNSDILWFHCGTNHLNPTIDTSIPSVAAIAANLRRILFKASTKPLVIVDALCPLASNSISGAAPRRTDIPLVNAAYRAVCAEFRNVVYNDVYTALAQDATTGLALAGMTTSHDGIHLTTKGAYTAGVATAQNLAAAGIVLRPFYRPTSYIGLPSMSGATGTKTASTGTINGTVATSCNVEIASNATGVVVTATPEALRPYSQRLRIVNGNANATVVRLQQASFTGGILTGLASGDTVRASGVVVCQSQSGLYRTDLIIQQDPSGTVVNFNSLQKSPKEDGNSDPFPVFPAAPFSARLYVNGTLTATPTSMNVVWAIEVASGGDVTLDFYGWTLEEVTAA